MKEIPYLKFIKPGRHLEHHGAVSRVVEVAAAGRVRQAGRVAPHYVVVGARVHTAFGVPLDLRSEVCYSYYGKIGCYLCSQYMTKVVQNVSQSYADL